MHELLDTMNRIYTISIRLRAACSYYQNKLELSGTLTFWSYPPPPPPPPPPHTHTHTHAHPAPHPHPPTPWTPIEIYQKAGWVDRRIDWYSILLKIATRILCTRFFWNPIKRISVIVQIPNGHGYANSSLGNLPKIQKIPKLKFGKTWIYFYVYP